MQGARERRHKGGWRGDDGLRGKKIYISYKKFKAEADSIRLGTIRTRNVVTWCTAVTLLCCLWLGKEMGGGGYDLGFRPTEGTIAK